MHRDFKRILKYATGESEFVLALNVDIRGFSEFSMTVDSSETAMYVKRAYAEIIDGYFPRAKFFKPTGDGLLIIEGFTERTLAKKVEDTVRASLKLLDDFPTITSDDPIINFEVPQLVGIGASRGAACRLVSRTKTLDYSGRVLNLASRLMGQARPSGLIFDSAFGPELLPPDLLRQFRSTTIFLKGIAEDAPVTVFHSPTVEIDESAKHPLGRIEWINYDRKFTLGQLKGKLPSQLFVLSDPPPLDPSQIQVKVITRNPRDREGPALVWDYKHFSYRFTAGTHEVTVEHVPIPEIVTNWGVRLNKEGVLVRVLYPASP